MQVQRSLTGTPFNAVQHDWESKSECGRSLAVRGFRFHLIKAEFSSLLYAIYEFVRVLLTLPFQCCARGRASLKFHWALMWQHLESAKSVTLVKPAASSYVFNEDSARENLAQDIHKEKLRDPEGWYKGPEMKKGLFWAMKHYNSTYIKIFIEKGVPVNYQLEAENSDGEIVTASLIYWAVKDNSYSSFSYLKDCGASTEGMLAFAIRLHEVSAITENLYKTEPWDVVFNQHFVNDLNYTHWNLIRRMESELRAAEESGKKQFTQLKEVLERGLPTILNRIVENYNYSGVDATNFLWLLEHLDITGFNLVGLSINGYPITREMVKHCKGSEGAIITKTELDAAARQDEATFRPLKEKIERHIASGQGRLLENGIIELVCIRDAAKGGNLSAVQHLCPRFKSTRHELIDALKGGNLSAVQHLCPRFKSTRHELIDAFLGASGRKHWDVAAYILQNCSEKEGMINSLYELGYIQEEGVGVLAQLIGDLDINELCPRILSYTIHKPFDQEKIQFLVSKGARFLNKKSKKDAVWNVIKEDAVEVLRVLYPLISQKKNWQIPYMYQAIVYASEATLRFLIESGGDINGKIKEKDPLLLEVLVNLKWSLSNKKSFTRIFFYLLDLLPTVKDYKNDTGSNLLHHAMPILSLSGEPVEQLYESLINKGADVNAANNTGLTPLHVAVQWDNEKGVDFLLAYGASVTSVDNKGYTPLHAAVNNEIRSKYETIRDYYKILPNGSDPVTIVTKLLASGADKNARTVDGKTPYDLALEAYSEKQQSKVNLDALSQILELLKPDDALVGSSTTDNQSP